MLGRPPARHGMIAKPSGIVFVALIVSSPRIQRWRWWATKTSQLPDQQPFLLPLLRLHFILRRDRHRHSHTQLMGRRSLNNNTQSPDSIIIIIIIGSLARRFNCVLVEETCRECHRSFCYFLCLRFAPRQFPICTLRYVIARHIKTLLSACSW